MGVPLHPSQWAAAIEILRQAGQEAAEEALTELQSERWQSWPKAAKRVARERRGPTRGVSAAEARETRAAEARERFLARFAGAEESSGFESARSAEACG